MCRRGGLPGGRALESESVLAQLGAAGAHLWQHFGRAIQVTLYSETKSLSSKVEKMDALTAAKVSAASFSLGIQSSAVQRPLRPSAFVTPSSKTSKLKHTPFDSWQHVLGRKPQSLPAKAQQQTAFRAKTEDKSVPPARRPQAACPCCGRRAALLGGAAAGLLLPNQGRAQVGLAHRSL